MERMSRKWMSGIVLLIGVFSLTHCAPFFPRLKDGDWVTYRQAMSRLHVGSAESVREQFETVGLEGGIGILGSSVTEVEGYYAQTFVIGYRQHEFVGGTQTVVVKHIICYISVVNGRVYSIYRP